MVSTQQMQISFDVVNASLTGVVHTLGHVLFFDTNHRSQTSLVGRVGRFDHWNRDHHLHCEYEHNNILYDLPRGEGPRGFSSPSYQKF